MKPTIRAVIFVLVLLIGTSGAETQAPRMRTTSAEVIAYFTSLRDAETDGFLIGQFGGYGSGQTLTLAETHFGEAAAKIGDCPAMTGWDLWNSDQTIAASGDEAFAFWQAHQNLFYTLSAHLRNPFTGGKADDVTGSNRLRELLGATGAGATYRGYLDEVAAQLQRFEDAGAVVLWRPLHEANGGWFWWGAGSDADYVALWRDMHTYFTKVKGLSNLVWVYAPNARFSRFDTMYPGSEYVDVVGLDYYKPLSDARLELNTRGEYDFLAGTGKPFYLTEFGARPASGAGWDTYAYNHQLTMDAARRYPALVGVLYWEHVWRISYRDDFNQPLFTTDPLAATCSDIPSYFFDDNPGGIPLPTATPNPVQSPTATPQGTTATPSPTATLAIPGGVRTFTTTDSRIVVVEYQPPSGRRTYLQAVTSIAGVQRVMFYFGSSWKADDATAPYYFGQNGFVIPAGQEVRVLVVYNVADEFVEGRFTYTTAPTPTPTYTPTPSINFIVCVAEGSAAVIDGDTVRFSIADCIIRRQ